MSIPEEPNDFERRTKALFDRSVDDVNGPTRTKLAQARAAALDQAESHVAHRRWRVLAPAVGLAAAAVGAVAVAIRSRGPGSESPTGVEDLELLASNDPEMLEEFEFYAWLDEQPEWRG